MTPDRSHSDTVGRFANKVRVEGGLAPFNPYFYVLKYHSSDVLPAPEIFLYEVCFWSNVLLIRLLFVAIVENNRRRLCVFIFLLVQSFLEMSLEDDVNKTEKDNI